MWELRADSAVDWTGVPLATSLEHAGIKNGSVPVILQRADKGQINEEPHNHSWFHLALQRVCPACS
jgi:hypothetical protein